LAEKHRLLTWAHELSKNRKKSLASWLLFVLPLFKAEARLLQSPWNPGRIGLIDKNLMTKDQNYP
jgi:hypothetical protein